MKRTVAILAAALAIGTCSAPILFGQADCAKWLSEYLLHQRAARRLRSAKWALTHTPTHHAKLSPLAALRKFEIACGDLETPTPTLGSLLPPMELDTLPSAVEWPTQPPEMPAARPADVAELAPAEVGPVASLPVAATPEVGTWLLVATGLGVLMVWRREVKA